MNRDLGFATVTIGIMMKMLQARYTDKEILDMLKPKRVKAILKVTSENLVEVNHG